MGVRTLFNLLGPLTNPANALNQVIGVFSKTWVEPVAQVLKRLGSEHVLVVHSEDGLDEISLSAPTYVAELNNGVITTYTLLPEELGFNRAALSDIQVNSVVDSVAMVRGVLDNQNTPARDIVALNAGAAIYAAGLTKSLAEGITQAQTVLSQGAVRDKLTAWVNLSQSF